MLRVVMAVGVALTVAACGSTIYSQMLDPPGKTKDYFVNCLKNNGFLAPSGDKVSVAEIATRLMEGVVPQQRWPVRALTSPMTVSEEVGQISALNQGSAGTVHRFLDCYVAHVEPDDIEGRLLRGQIVTALLAQYASASLIAKERTAKADDAATIIFHIRRASIQLASVSPEALEGMYSLTGRNAEKAVTDKIDSKASSDLKVLVLGPLRNFRTAQRTAAVFDIGTDISRVDNRYAAANAGTIFDVVSTTVATGGFNPSVVPKLQGLLESAVAGLSLTAQSQWYGSAFIRDAQDSLFSNMKDPATVRRHWIAWQTRINAACDSLKAVADTRTKPCEPTAIEMAEFIKREYPDHPYLDALLERAAIDVKKK